MNCGTAVRRLCFNIIINVAQPIVVKPAVNAIKRRSAIDFFFIRFIIKC